MRGSQFAPDGQVSLSLDGNGSIASADTSSHGSFVVSVSVPNATIGTHMLSASETDPTNGSALQASTALTILGTASNPTDTPTPSPSGSDPASSAAAIVHAASSTSTESPARAATKLASAGSASISAAGSTSVFTAEADARVEEAHPNTNYGRSTTLGVDGDPNAKIQSYIRFTVSGISGPIQNAVLRLHVTSNGGPDGPSVLPANNNWKESAITWATSPPTWGRATGDLGAIPPGAWAAFDVTPLVTKTGQFTFKLVASSVDGIEFSSRESLQPPQLVINQNTAANPTQNPVSQSPAPTATATSASSPTSVQTDASSNPFEGASFFIDPLSAAMAQATAWRSTRPADASQMDKIANQPEADWFDNGSGDISTAVDRRVSTITDAGALPVLVAYNIPKRDCASTGASSASAYQSWIRAFAKGIGTRKAVVILEPDALANIGCLSEADQTARISLIEDAVTVLGAQPGVAVYIDAGHSNWVSASTMAGLLTQAGIDRAQGFSLNVASFGSTADNIAYGRDLSSRVGGKHFIIDTSRNGLGPAPDYAWCNPPGRALGPSPTASTGDQLVDAYFWIKRPGESDGTCNGGPVAGLWWPDYALGLAKRAP